MKSYAFLTLLITAVAGQAETAVVPERLPIDRYAKLKSEAPFAVKTPDVTTVEPKIDWAEALYLSGAGKDYVNGVEVDWAYINHKSDPSASFRLLGNEPGKDNIQIVKLDWHPENPFRTEVHLKKGTEFAIIKRDQAPPPVMQPQPGGPRPGQPTTTGIPGTGGPIRQPVGQPRGTPVIPRPGGAGAVPVPQAQGTQAAPQPQAVPGVPQPAGAAPAAQGGDRRRIRVINSR